MCNYFYIFFFYLSNFFIKYYLCEENVNKHAKNINNTQNDKPQSQIKAKLFNIQLLLCHSVFTIQFLMNQNFQFQKKKKKKRTVTCCSVLSQLSTCSLVGPLSTKPKERSERFGVGVYLLSSLKSLSWILTFHNFIYRHIKCIGQKFVCMVATRGQHILLPRRCGLQNQSKRK